MAPPHSQPRYHHRPLASEANSESDPAMILWSDSEPFTKPEISKRGHWGGSETGEESSDYGMSISEDKYYNQRNRGRGHRVFKVFFPSAEYFERY